MKKPLHPIRGFLNNFSKPGLIYPVSFLHSAAFTMVALGMVFLLRDRFGASAGTIGLSTGLYSVLYFAGCMGLRPLTLRLLPRISLLLSATLSATLLIVVLLSRSIEVVIIAYGSTGLSVALFWPPVMGWLSAGMEGQVLNRVFSRFNFSWSAGVIIGPFLAGVLTETSVRLPLIVAIAMILTNATAILVLSIVAQAVRTDLYRDTRVPRVTSTGGGTPLRFPSWMGVVAAYATLGALGVVFPLFGRGVMGMPERVIGMMLVVRGFSATVVFVWMGRSDRWHFRKVPLMASVGLILAAAVGLAVAQTAWAFVILIAMVGAGAAASYTIAMFHGVSGSPDRTRRMAIHEASLTVGSVLGVTVGGTLYQHGGIHAAFLFCGALALLALVAQAAFLIWGPREPRSGSFALPAGQPYIPE